MDADQTIVTEKARTDVDDIEALLITLVVDTGQVAHGGSLSEYKSMDYSAVVIKSGVFCAYHR